MIELRTDKLYKCAFFDPKGANPNTRGTSRGAVVVVGMDELERVFVLSSWAAFCGVDEMLNRVFNFDKKWHPAIFGVDTTGNQALWLDMIRREAERKQLPAPKVRGIEFTANKRQV